MNNPTHHRTPRRLRRFTRLRLAPAAPTTALPPPRPARPADFLDLCLYPGMARAEPPPELAYPTAV